jgi:hypothetical protein
MTKVFKDSRYEESDNTGRRLERVELGWMDPRSSQIKIAVHAAYSYCYLLPCSNMSITN